MLCAAAALSGGNAIAVISLLLVALSVLGAFETPTVQACIPQMLSGDDIVRGNAVVNQVAPVSYLTAPMLGGVLYAAFGLKPVMDISVACFFITASFECFIRLRRQPMGHGGNVLRVIRHDFIISIKFNVAILEFAIKKCYDKGTGSERDKIWQLYMTVHSGQSYTA